MDAGFHRISVTRESFSDATEELNASLSKSERKHSRRTSSLSRSILAQSKCEEPESGWDTDLEDETRITERRHDLTGESVYLKSCKALKIIPSNHVVKSLSKSVFSARHRALGPKEVQSISGALVSNTFVKSLDIEGNNIGEKGTKEVFRLLLENCFITDLNLSENCLGSQGAAMFGNILKKTRSLSKVILKGCKFGDKDGAVLAEGIAANDTVKILNISHNEFRSNAGKELGIAISKNQTLVELDLSWNHLRTNGAIAIGNAMEKNCSIETLKLRFNGFSDSGAAAMGVALMQNTTLKVLDLSNNRISDRGAVALSNGIEKNNTLQSINMSYNPITTQGGIALLSATKEAKELMELLMDGVFLDEVAFELIQFLISSRNSLKISYQGIAKESGSRERKNELELLKQKIFDRIRNYLRENRLRMIDLFNRWDKDKSLALCREEFELGIAKANMPLSPEMIDFLVNELDSDKNGTVDYREFVAISGIE